MFVAGTNIQPHCIMSAINKGIRHSRESEENASDSQQKPSQSSVY